MQSLNGYNSALGSAGRGSWMASATPSAWKIFKASLFLRDCSSCAKQSTRMRHQENQETLNIKVELQCFNMLNPESQSLCSFAFRCCSLIALTTTAIKQQ